MRYILIFFVGLVLSFQSSAAIAQLSLEGTPVLGMDLRVSSFK